MVLNRVERIYARRQVDAMILADPVMITPMRSTRTADGAGGFISTPAAVGSSIQVTIVPAKRRLSDILVNTELGDLVEYPYIILGRYNIDLKRKDTFTWNGDKFEVKSIHIKQEVSTVAQVDYFGGTHNG